MAHREHNSRGAKSGLFLIILGAMLFILSTTYLLDSPSIGQPAVVLGFIIGGIGFYLNFKNRRQDKK